MTTQRTPSQDRWAMTVAVLASSVITFLTIVAVVAARGAVS